MLTDRPTTSCHSASRQTYRLVSSQLIYGRNQVRQATRVVHKQPTVDKGRTYTDTDRQMRDHFAAETRLSLADDFVR